MGIEKKDIGHHSPPAKVYTACLATVALLLAAWSAAHWQPGADGQFVLYLLCGILSSKMKVGLPGMTGKLPVNYVFILASAMDLSLMQTAAVGCACGLAQLYASARKRPRLVQAVLTVAGTTISSGVAWTVYRRIPVFHNIPIRLFWASMAYFASASVAMGATRALTEGKKLRRLWQDNLFWTAPHYLVGGALAGLLHWWNEHAGWAAALLVFPALYLVYHSYRLYVGRLEEEKRHVAEIADLHLRTIQALALAIDARDGTTHAHLRRVQVYARELARELGLPEDECRALEAASLLHDIGKLAVPESIISKPGKLTAEEFEKMKVHPIVGAEILASVQFPYPVVPVVMAHHEKWNGTGYPFGLKGEQIPMGARIVAAVDCLDALASDRQYRRALPLDEAMRRVSAEAGTAFDPHVVEVLSKRYAEFEALARQHVPDLSLLSAKIRVERGKEPGAGIEPSAVMPVSHHAEFIASIAGARQEVQALVELIQEQGTSLSTLETLALLALRLRKLVPCHGIAIYTVAGGRLKTRYADGTDAALFSSLEIPLGEGISGWVAQNDKPIVNGNPSVEPGYLNDPARFSTLRSALSVPLPGIQGIVGALTLYHLAPSAFTRDHLRLLLAVSSKAGLTVEKALRFVPPGETAATDALTGLPNGRALFLRLDSDLEKARTNGARLGVLAADLDGFRLVNDHFGTVAGNQVLEKIGRAIQAILQAGEFGARMGGDEFVLLFPGASPETMAGRVRQLEMRVAESSSVVCPSGCLRVSTGAAYFPEDGGDAEELLRKADARMYEAKRRRQGGTDSGLARLAGALEVESQRATEDVATSRIEEAATAREAEP